jgi:small subunit ribosomal protein S16
MVQDTEKKVLVSLNYRFEFNNLLKGGEKMAVKMRLKRMGDKKRPFYRVVVADSRFPRDGRFIEEIGTYNPLVDPAEIKINDEKAKKWIGHGAQPTDTVKALLKKAGILQ